MTIHHMMRTGQVIVRTIDGQHMDEWKTTLERKLENVEGFNDATVNEHHQNSASRIIQAYEDAHAEAADRLTRIPAEKLRQNGILASYGEAYDLEDFMVYPYYAHKREHCAQIAVYRDTLAPARH